MAGSQAQGSTEFVTNEGLEAVLVGIATQIASGIADAKSGMTGLVTEAELRWQSKLSEQLEAHGVVAPPPELSAFRAELAQNQAEVDGKLRAQNAELQQLQQGLTDL